jgi:hypothetical protein
MRSAKQKVKKLNMMLDSKDDIEILGFLSTTLNIQVASLYSRCHLQNNYETESESCIYIIEVDESKTYINLNDNLYQFLLLPYSIIKIVYEFYYMEIKIILCRLIKTPTREQNNELYDKLLQKKDIMAVKVGGEMTIQLNEVSDVDKEILCDEVKKGGHFASAKINAQKKVVTQFYKKLLPTNDVKEKVKEKSSGTTREEANNKINASISQYKSMYKFTDLPKNFQEYYKEEEVELPFDENEEIDIYNGCHFRLIPKELEKSKGGSVRKKKVKSLKNPILSNSVKKVRKGK